MNEFILLLSLWLVGVCIAFCTYKLLSLREIKQEEKDFLLLLGIIVIAVWIIYIMLQYLVLIISIFYLSWAIALISTYLYIIALIFVLGVFTEVVMNYITKEEETFLETLLGGLK